MPVESWIAPEDAPALAAEASALIDAVLAARGDIAHDVYWATIRKAYNTPYNDPKPRKLVGLGLKSPAAPAPVAEPVSLTVEIPVPPLPVAAMALAQQAVPLEIHAG